MNKNKRNIITEIAAFVISAIVCTACWLVGYFYVESSKPFLYAAIASVVLIVAAIFVNRMRAKALLKGLNGTDLRDASLFENASGDACGDSGNTTDSLRIKTDRATAESRAIRAMRGTFAYSAAIMLLLCAACFLMGSAEPTFTDDEGGISLAILPLICVLGQGIVAFLIRKEPAKKQPHLDNRITEKEFPLIVGAAKNAARSLGIGKEVRIYYTSNEITVNDYKNAIHILLNPINVASLTAAELKSVLLHDLSLCIDADAAKADKLAAFADKPIGSVSEFGIFALISFRVSKTLLAITLYHKLSARKTENQADEFIAECGEADNYVNATAKIELYRRYRTYIWRETDYEVYANETPIGDYAHFDFKNFKTKLAVYRDRWFFSLYNELPSPTDNRPTAAMRMAACGKTSFNVDTTETNPDYVAEQEKYLTLADKILFENFPQEEYDFTREEKYIERNEIFAEYEKKGDFADFESETEKIKYANAFIGVDNEKALELLDRVLDSSTNSLAYFLKGVILSDEYDDGCIEMFTRAAQNTAFFDEASEFLLSYAFKTGKKDYIDEFEKSFIQKKRASMDEDYATEITRNKLFSPDRTDLINHEVVGLIKEYWNDDLSAVYLAEHTTETGVVVKYIAIEIDEKENKDYYKAHYDTVDMLFRYSDEKTKFYFYYNGCKEFNLIKKTPDSLMFSAAVSRCG